MVHYSRFTKRVLAGTHENNDAEKTSFVTNVGLHQFRVMPFSLCNATGTFQRLIECVLSDIRVYTYRLSSLVEGFLYVIGH